ncbi:MAG: PleD family two-component system response regulator [Bacteroidota bacterium]
MSNGLKILVVDDEPDVIEILKYNLAKAGYDVTPCLNGEEAVKIAKNNSPDLILMDIRMPGMTGIEACRELKSDPEFGSTPIVFLTADSDDYTTLNAMSVGGDDFLTKPIHPKLLVNIVDELLKNKAGISV